MRVESVLIEEIQVGERRREEFGDIEGLADSIGKFGLFHPVVIDGDSYRLIAGERRLRACRDVLGWMEIPCRLYDELSEEERHEIELEENVRRKDLTTFEASKRIKRKAEAVAPIIASKLTGEVSSAAEETSAPSNKGGRPKSYAAPKEEVAKALGIGTASLVRAEQHVAAVERYPELSLIPTQKDAITVARNLDKLPAGERSEARSKLMNHDQPTLARLAEKPPMPPSKPKAKSAGGKWRDNLSQIRVFLQSIKALGGGAELTANWTEQERHAFLAELWEFSGELKELIKELEDVEKELEQRV